MKMIYNNTPIKSLNIKHFEMNTNSATVQPQDMQVGITAYAKGKKVVGTGRCFEFAYYGGIRTNQMQYIPNIINVIEIASVSYPIQLTTALTEMENIDFTKSQVIGYATVDGVAYEITVQVSGNFMTVSCEKTIDLEIFCGKDNYV